MGVLDVLIEVVSIEADTNKDFSPTSRTDDVHACAIIFHQPLADEEISEL